jgi:uncharacterized membrane protein/protein-disulfide isomerase
VKKPIRKDSPKVAAAAPPSARASWLLALAALGLVASGASTVVHYRLLQTAGYTSFCDINSTLSCTEAYLSSYGSLAGVPVALLGFLWFVLAGVLAWLTVRGRPEIRESAPGYLFVLSTVALAMVLYLGYASFAVLKTVCVLCVGTYVAVVGLFLVSGSLMSYPMTSLPRLAARDLRRLVTAPLALALALVLLGGAAGAVALFPREGAPGAAQSSQPGGTEATQAAGNTAGPSEFQKWYEQQPVADPGVPAEGAKVLVVKFNDYQCPACGQSYRDYRPIFAKYETSHPGVVRQVTRDYPLEPECNFNVPTGSHHAACEAAAAVRLSARKGRAAEMEEWLFANQQRLTTASVRQAAQAIGGVSDFDAQYPAMLQAIRGDVAAGGALGVRSTPTFFINGRVLRGALPAQYFEEAIAIEQKRAGVK